MPDGNAPRAQRPDPPANPPEAARERAGKMQNAENRAALRHDLMDALRRGGDREPERSSDEGGAARPVLGAPGLPIQKPERGVDLRPLGGDGGTPGVVRGRKKRRYYFLSEPAPAEGQDAGAGRAPGNAPEAPAPPGGGGGPRPG